MKKLIIVCDKTTEKHGNYLRQLISSNDDQGETIVGIKDGEVDAVVWNEEQYRANSPQISSSQHIIFIGNGQVSQCESANIKCIHDKFGMKYGWIGKRGVAFVDKILTEEDYNNFLEYCKEYGMDNEKVQFKLFGGNNINENSDIDNNKENKNLNNNNQQKSIFDNLLISTAIASGVAGLLGGISMLGAHGINALVVDGKVKEQQYSAMIAILYLKDLGNFMEN